MTIRASRWWFVAINRRRVTISTGWPLDRFWVIDR